MPTMTTRTLPWYAVPWIVTGWSHAKRYPVLPLALLIFVLVIPAVFAPWVAPHDPFASQMKMAHQQ